MATQTLPWHVLDLRLLCANAVAAALATMAAPLFYSLMWLTLRGRYNIEFSIFKDLAMADLDRATDQAKSDEAPRDTQGMHDVDGKAESCDWFAVLGISPAAGVAEIKTAYKTLIKQNHPDRVHGMSAAFRELAELNTQRINAAYHKALIASGCG